MKPIKCLLPITLIGALAGYAQSGHADNDPYPAAHPSAGIQPKRPANYQPYKYPLSAQELLAKDGPAMAKLSKAAWADIERVNGQGKFNNTRESLATHQCPEWFKDAKIGMFIDWGPWSVGGYSPTNQFHASGALYPDWYEKFIHVKEPVKQYHAQTWGADIGNDDLINLLSDRRFDSHNFARLAKACGFRYVIPFLKHHGGFCLWDSSYTHRDSMDWAFHRDFATELSKACKQVGLKFGAYVSVGEWDYPAIRPDGQLGSFGFDAKLSETNILNDCIFLSGKIPVKDFARDYLIPATKELIDKTAPDILWWDGEWENTSEFYRTRDLNAYYFNRAAQNHQAVCINDRSGNDYRGKKKDPACISDFITSEYGGGNEHDDAAWEECRSFSHNFGYNWTEESDPTAILSDKACIDLVVDIIGRGGNLLLIVSPTGTGEIPARQLHAINNLGDWLKQHGEAIYNTRAYKLAEQPKWGRITHSKDNQKVYLHITHWPADGRIEVPRIPVESIETATVMNGQGMPGFTQPTQDGFTVDLSGCLPGDPRVSVIVLNTK